MWKEKYELWKNSNLPSDLREELLSLSEKEKEDAFYTDIAFGTAGLRGLMGVGTNRINEIIVKKITLGYGNYLVNNKLTGGVAISYDNRINSKKFAYTAAKVLASLNIKTFIYPELRPTPMLSFAVRHFKADGGIMITASHNPKEYNGYKVYNKEGGQLNLEDSEKVIAEVNKITDIFNINEVDNDNIHWIDLEKIDNIYLNEVEKITINNPSVKASIVYSSLHGTGGTVIPKLLEKYNYPIYTYKPHLAYDGNFSNTKSTNPEEFIAYEELIDYANSINADIVAITDPDADRLGVAVKHNNEYTVLTGNQIAVILLYYIVTQKKINNLSLNNGYVFTSNVTSDLIIKIAKDYGLNVIKTLSGFKFIAEEITKIPENGQYIFGCEESNGSIINPFVRDKDAVQGVFMFAEIASYVKTNNLDLIDYLNEIYDKYGYHFEQTNSYTFKGATGKDKMNNLIDSFRKNNLNLDDAKLVIVEDNLTKKSVNLENNIITPITLPMMNAIKFIYDDESWIIIRPSGTEPKLKVYLSATENSYSKARDKVLNRIKQIEQLIK